MGNLIITYRGVSIQLQLSFYRKQIEIKKKKERKIEIEKKSKHKQTKKPTNPQYWQLGVVSLFLFLLLYLVIHSISVKRKEAKCFTRAHCYSKALRKTHLPRNLTRSNYRKQAQSVTKSVMHIDKK